MHFNGGRKACAEGSLQPDLGRRRKNAARCENLPAPPSVSQNDLGETVEASQEEALRWAVLASFTLLNDL